MPRSLPWILLAAGLLLLPGPAGRLLLDLVGGLTLLLVLLPVLAAGAAFLGWTLLQRRLRTCPSCGLVSMGTEACPACGTRFEAATASDVSAGSWRGSAAEAIDPRDVTINVEAVDVGREPGGAQPGSASLDRPSH